MWELIGEGMQNKSVMCKEKVVDVLKTNFKIYGL